MDTALKDLTFVVFDTETTGLDPEMDRLLEIAAIAFRLDGQILAQFQTLIDDGQPIPEKVSAIHGITAATVRGAPSLIGAVALFAQFIEPYELEMPAVYVAHNAPFDIGFVGKAFRRVGEEPLPERPVLDSQEVAKAHWLYYRLQTIAARQGIDPGNAHRALADCHTTMTFLLRLLRQLEPDDTLIDLPGAILYGWDGQVWGHPAPAASAGAPA